MNKTSKLSHLKKRFYIFMMYNNIFICMIDKRILETIFTESLYLFSFTEYVLLMKKTFRLLIKKRKTTGYVPALY